MKKIFSQLIILVSLFATSASTLANKAPDFSLKTATDQIINLKAYQGKPLIIHFWATWCPYCKKLQPGLDKLYVKYKNQGLEMIAISFWEEEGAKPQLELEQRGMHFSTLINGDKVADLYGVSGTPTTFFIKKNGEVLFKTNISDPNSEKLEQAVLAILEK